MAGLHVLTVSGAKPEAYFAGGTQSHAPSSRTTGTEKGYGEPGSQVFLNNLVGEVHGSRISGDFWWHTRPESNVESLVIQKLIDCSLRVFSRSNVEYACHKQHLQKVFSSPGPVLSPSQPFLHPRVSCMSSDAIGWEDWPISAVWHFLHANPKIRRPLA